MVAVYFIFPTLSIGLFKDICAENGILSSVDECFKFMYEFPEKYSQMSLFDGEF